MQRSQPKLGRNFATSTGLCPASGGRSSPAIGPGSSNVTAESAPTFGAVAKPHTDYFQELPLPGKRPAGWRLFASGQVAASDQSGARQKPNARRNIVVLIISNLLGGLGIYAGFAVSTLLIESMSSTAIAGLGQAFTVLGAAVASIVLAKVADQHGRRSALWLGYAIALFGGLLILVAAATEQLLLLLAAMILFGVARSSNLQSRYAAADNAELRTRGSIIAIVVWATTFGSATGPNLSEVGAGLGKAVGLPPLSGPFLFAIASFLLAGGTLALFYRDPDKSAQGTKPQQRIGTMAALRWAKSHPRAWYAVVLTATAHATMVSIMVMTPLHMKHGGLNLTIVGFVISGHILGMYALSPVFGIMADRWGAMETSLVGIAVLLLSTVLGMMSGAGFGGVGFTAFALVLLGLGWSACIIAASAILATEVKDEVRIPLQGATDAGMNLSGASAAALAGSILAFGGFVAVNLVGAVVLLPAIALLPAALRSSKVVKPSEQAA